MSRAVSPTQVPKRLTVSIPTRGRSSSCSSTTPFPGSPGAGTLKSTTSSQPVYVGYRKSPASLQRHFKCHQRSQSAYLLPGDAPDFNLPGYARPTERSRSRSQSRVRSNSDGSSSTPTPSEAPTGNRGQVVVTQDGVRGEQGTTSTLKITTDGINPNALRIDSKPGFKLEVHILATNAIEVVAVPIQDQPIPPSPPSPLVILTPPCSPSTSILDNDILAPDLSKIPALNISAPAELDSNPPSSEYLYEEEQKAPAPPQSAEEHLEAVTAFIEKRNISTFFESGGKDAGGLLRTLSYRAAALVKDLEEGKVDAVGDRSFITNAATVADIVKVSLYDQVIFCDDSYSMLMYDRVGVLKDTLKSVGELAILLNEPHQSGISLRFINHKNDGHMNNLTSVSEIEKAISEVSFDGNTRLGTQLKRKVLIPFLVDRLERQRRKLDKPILITIITDGKPEGEDRSELKDTILWCKEYMESMGYGPWAVGFHIAQVGDCPAALAYLKEIQDDPQVREHVYVSMGVSKGVTAPSKLGWEKENKLRWLTSLVRAIEH